MASKIEVNLDTSKEIYKYYKCKQNDDLTLIANIFDNGAAKDLTNCSIVIQAKKADKTSVIQNTDIKKLDKKFEANLVRDFTRAPGETLIEVVLVEGGKQNTTFSFILEVYASVIKGAEESKDLITSLEVMQDAVVEMGKISEETKELIQNSGAASKEEMNKVNASLAEKQNKDDNKLLTTVKNIVGAINEIYNGIKTEIISRRLRGQNSPDSPAGTFDSANFAGQGKTTGIPIGNVFHHYTDGKLMQLDNVGSGVALTIVNANNPTRRSDKPSDYFGSGYFIQLYTNNPSSGIYDHLTIDEKGMLFWSGYTPTGVKTNSTTFTTGKDYGYTPAFIFKCTKEHEVLMQLINTSYPVMNFNWNKSANCAEINIPSEIDGLNVKTNKGDIRMQIPSGKALRVDGSIYAKNLDGISKDVLTREVGNTSQRPTSLTGKRGMPYFDVTLNKPIWVDQSESKWIETIGNFVSVPPSKTSSGNKGDFSADENYFYVCIGINSWIRIAKDSSW